LEERASFGGDLGDQNGTGVAVAHGERRTAETDFERFTERGTTDDMNGRAGDQAELAEAGEVGRMEREAVYQSSSAGEELGERNGRIHDGIETVSHLAARA
jgi:hypothetical protein